MSKVLGLYLLLFFFTNCSLDTKTGFWTKSEKTIIEEKKSKIKQVFKSEKALEQEFNSDFKITLTTSPSNISFSNNLTNNNGRINYDGTLKKSSKFKFKEIDKFNKFEPEIIFHEKNIIFFDNKGAILKFNEKSKIIWKQNHYTKSEKKLKPILFFGSNKDYLLVADSISKYYALDIKSGEKIWSKTNSSPFNSQIKVYKDKFFVIDFDSKLNCFSVIDGKKLWEFKSENSFIKSQKKLSIVIADNKVFFNNSIGDITAIDIDSGALMWQTPTQSNSVYEDAFSLKTSDLIADNISIYFSNNKNEFYSLNLVNGNINWMQKINSSIRSTLIQNLIFSITEEGFFVVTEKLSGEIIRITDIFEEFTTDFILEGVLRTSMKPTGFIVGEEKIYLTTDNGKLLVIDISTGKLIKVLKIDNKKNISRPFASNQNLFIVKEDAIIKLK